MVKRLMQIRGMWSHLAGAVTLDERDCRILRELYEGDVATADELVGQILDALTRLEIPDDTLVVVTADHGENIGEHGMIDHLLSMYDTTLGVPLIIRYPGRFAAGAVVDGLVSLVDVAPTLAQLCGLPPEGGSGPSPGAILGDPGWSGRAFVVAENDRPLNGIELLNRSYPTFDTRTIDRRMRAIRTTEYKLVWPTGGTVELYDLAADPDELHSVAEQEPAVRDDLLGRLRRWSEALARSGEGAPFESQDSESIEQLRSLEYFH